MRLLKGLTPVVLVVGSLVLPAGALAASGAASPQSRPHAAALAHVGLSVAWPLRHATTTLQPDARLVVRVRVKSPRLARHRELVLTLTRPAGAGRPRHVVRRLRFRHGNVAVRLPRVRDARYVLSLRTGKLRYAATILVQAVRPPAAPPSSPPAPPAVTPPPPSVPPGKPVEECTAGAGPPQSLTLADATLAAGDSLGYTLSRGDDQCMVLGSAPSGAFMWSQLIDGSWQPVGPAVTPIPPSAVLTTKVPPHTPSSGVVAVPSDFAPGHYRVSIQGLLAEFDIILSIAVPPAAG